MSRVFIRPLDGKSMRCPDTSELLSPAGREVELNSYWRRRLAEKAIEIVAPTPKSRASKGDTP